MSNLCCAIPCGSHRPACVPQGGLTGMADEGRGRELPQRVPREAWAATSPSGTPAPVLSAELRQRLEAAVIAERSDAAAREQESPAGGEVTSPWVRSGNALGGPGPPGPRAGGRAGSTGAQG